MELSPKHNLLPSIKTVSWKYNCSDGIEFSLIKHLWGRHVLRADRGAPDLIGPGFMCLLFILFPHLLLLSCCLLFLLLPACLLIATLCQSSHLTQVVQIAYKIKINKLWVGALRFLLGVKCMSFGAWTFETSNLAAQMPFLLTSLFLGCVPDRWGRWIAEFQIGEVSTLCVCVCVCVCVCTCVFVCFKPCMCIHLYKYLHMRIYQMCFLVEDRR